MVRNNPIPPPCRVRGVGYVIYWVKVSEPRVKGETVQYNVSLIEWGLWYRLLPSVYRETERGGRGVLTDARYVLHFQTHWSMCYKFRLTCKPFQPLPAL